MLGNGRRDRGRNEAGTRWQQALNAVSQVWIRPGAACSATGYSGATAFYLTEVPGQQAVVTDLSVGGCRLESQADLKMAVGTRMQLHIHVPEDERPLIIDEAVVCSYPGKGVGLIFTKVRRMEKRRIAGIIRERYAGTSLDCEIT